MLNQDEIRERYKERIKKERQSYISKVTGINPNALSRFKLNQYDLWPEHLQILADYLDGKLEDRINQGSSVDNSQN